MKNVETSSKVERKKRPVSVEFDILNTTSYSISLKYLSVQLTGLEVRIGRLLLSLDSGQQSRMQGWSSTITWNLGDKQKNSYRCNFEV